MWWLGVTGEMPIEMRNLNCHTDEIICQSNGTNGELIFQLFARRVFVRAFFHIFSFFSMKLQRVDRIHGPPTETEIHLKV